MKNLNKTNNLHVQSWNNSVKLRFTGSFMPINPHFCFTPFSIILFQYNSVVCQQKASTLLYFVFKLYLARVVIFIMKVTEAYIYQAINQSLFLND